MPKRISAPVTVSVRKEFICQDDPRFAECHASTLAALPDVERVAAWFGGSREGAGDVGIWVARRADGQWERPVKVAAEEGLPHWNPVLFAPSGGELLLFYKVGRHIPDWHTRIMRSADGGRTWGRPEELVPGDRGGRGPVKNKVLVLSDGTWLAPASIEGDVWDAFVDISTDGGRSWCRSETLPLDHRNFQGLGVIQPTLWESAPGNVHMLLRSSCGFVCRSDSRDGGRTWSRVCRTALVNNNSGIDLTKLPGGLLVLLHNPVALDWGPRTPLVASISDDNGLSWEKVATLEHREESGMEFSYPAVITLGSVVEVTYTWMRRGIVHARISGLRRPKEDGADPGKRNEKEGEPCRASDR